MADRAADAAGGCGLDADPAKVRNAILLGLGMNPMFIVVIVFCSLAPSSIIEEQLHWDRRVRSPLQGQRPELAVLRRRVPSEDDREFRAAGPYGDGARHRREGNRADRRHLRAGPERHRIDHCEFSVAEQSLSAYEALKTRTINGGIMLREWKGLLLADPKRPI